MSQIDLNLWKYTYCYCQKTPSEILSLSILIWVQFTKKGEKNDQAKLHVHKRPVRQCPGLVWAQEMLREIAELFNFFFFVCLNIESLCSLSHCDVKSPVGNVFPEQLGLWLCIPSYYTSLILASYLPLICTCFIFGTHHKNTVLCQGLTQLYLWVWPRHKKSKSKKGVLGEFIAR